MPAARPPFREGKVEVMVRVRLAQGVGGLICVALVVGCTSQSPYAVDPPLREAANRYSTAVTTNDRAAIARLAAPGDQARVDAVVTACGGRPTVPLAFDSRDRGDAEVEFQVTCNAGTRTMWQRFVYTSGQWRPDLSSSATATTEPIPAATIPAGVLPTADAEPGCR